MRTKYKFLILAVFSIFCLQRTLSAEIPKNTQNYQVHAAVVDFAKCIMDSKYGMLEQEGMESMKNQMQKAIEDIQEQLSDNAAKLQNKDYLDSLSPEAEKEMQKKCQMLAEELNRHQNQFYQIMQQAQMQVVQTMHGLINEVSQGIAAEKGFQVVLNKETAFYFDKNLDITNEVVTLLDQKFEKEGKSLAKDSEKKS